ncbi:hypothetical protein ACFWF3_34875, partial [Nocardia sp. NPDC060220]|uniref:hypothetical protein n=1 Tax=Nocardia sp. NPDC060220 TaxID=3347076 RepID=UPI00364A67DD
MLIFNTGIRVIAASLLARPPAGEGRRRPHSQPAKITVSGRGMYSIAAVNLGSAKRRSMSAYGPVLFVSRKDGADLSEQEQVLELVRAACLGSRMTDGEGFPVE